MKKYKLQIPISELFDFLNVDKVDTLYQTNRNISILDSNRKFTNILGFTKKIGNVYKYDLEDGTQFICDENHLIKQVNNSFSFIKNANHVIKNNVVVKIVNSSLKKECDFVYDISIPSPHEYMTSDGVISHNSSIANLLVKNLDCEVKYINAAQDNGIETVRQEILNYCTTSSFAKLKIMVLDEFSEFTPQGQFALNAVMEQYSRHSRFILTCNAVENIIPKIRSRCQEFRIVPPTKEQVKKRCEYILGKEGIDYETTELDEIIKHNYPDIRKIIQYLNQQSVNKVLKLDKDFYQMLRYEEQVITLLKNANDKNLFDNVNKIRQLIADNRVKNFLSLYKTLYEKIDSYTPQNKILPVIFRIQEGLKSDVMIADKEINMISTILRVLEILSEK